MNKQQTVRDSLMIKETQAQWTKLIQVMLEWSKLDHPRDASFSLSLSISISNRLQTTTTTIIIIRFRAIGRLRLLVAKTNSPSNSYSKTTYIKIIEWPTKFKSMNHYCWAPMKIAILIIIIIMNVVVVVCASGRCSSSSRTKKCV